MGEFFNHTYAINVFKFVMHQEEFFSDKKWKSYFQDNNIHLYFICRTPRVKIDNKQSFIFKDKIHLHFYTDIEEKRENIVIDTINNLNLSHFESDYPYNLFNGYDHSGKLISQIKSNLLLKYLIKNDSKYQSLMNCEVLYVGQAYGKKNRRSTIERLKNHEKAQAIYADTMRRFPDYEIWFVSMSIESHLSSMLIPRTYDDTEKTQKAFSDDIDIIANPDKLRMSPDQELTVAEAAFIKYFNTEKYNIEYLNFPVPNQTSYSQCYDLDLKSVHIALDSKCILTKFFTPRREPQFIHTHYFQLKKGLKDEIFDWLYQNYE